MKWLAPILAAALSGCATIGWEPDGPKPPHNWRTIAKSEIWVRQPNATVALGRDLEHGSEQLIGLSNETILEGENVLLLRAHRPGGRIGQVPRLEDFMGMARGWMGPFDADVEGRLIQEADAAGRYNWAETTGRGGVRCVLAMRRIDRTDALLPQDFIALDAVLRNCVTREDEDALAPISLTRIATVNTGSNLETIRTLSHLAGPRSVGR